MTLSIVGLYYYDYHSCPEKLRELTPGEPIVLISDPACLESDETVCAMRMDFTKLGVVASEQLSALRGMLSEGKESVVARFVSYSERDKRIEVELTGEAPCEAPEPDHLADWQPIGQTLRYTADERLLDQRMTVLQELAASEELPWSLTLDQLRDLVHDYLSHDWSRTAHERIRTLCELLGRSPVAERREAAGELRKCMARMARPESREDMIECLRLLAASDDIYRLLSFEEKDVMAWLNDWPERYSDLYQERIDVLIGRFWYDRLPRPKLRALLTRLCLNLYTEHELHGEEDPADEASAGQSPSAGGNAPIAAPTASSDDPQLSFPSGAALSADQSQFPAAEAADAASPSFRFFTSKADEQDRATLELQLQDLCTKRNGCSEVVRYLRRQVRAGLILDVFTDKKKLLLNLREFGLEASLKTLQNAASRNL